MFSYTINCMASFKTCYLVSNYSFGKISTMYIDLGNLSKL